jgi:2,4-dienoyl-CoA reductase-like NADH-dependent reductase (Old Yellow Enzyme family)
MSDMPFLPIRIGNLELKNRFLMSAAVDGMAADPHARAQRYAGLASGGVGLIVAGRVMNNVEEFGRVADAVHENGGRIALQILSHVGLGFAPNADSSAASVVPEDSVIFSSYFPYGRHHEASEGEIENMIASFVDAAKLAISFGVDALEVHSAHNSALFQFLTPLINQRKDKWGGSVENRVRLHQEVYRAVRSEIGPDMPIFIKLGVEDVFPNGLKLAEGVAAAKLLAECGYDAVEVSQGLQDFRDPRTMAGTPIRANTVKISQEGYFRAWCREVKKAIDKPTIMTGGIRSYELVEEVLAGGETDMIGMCRPFVKEPGLVKRWEGGDRKKASCISCNKCGLGMIRGLPLACYVKEKWSI